MKIGVCRGLDDIRAMESAKNAGIDYFECGFGSLARFDDEKFNRSKEALEKLNLPCIAANGFIPGDMKLVGDKVDYGAIEEYLDKGFQRASSLGVKKIVLGSGSARSFDEGFSPEKAKEQIAYFLKEYAAPKAKTVDCIIVLEPLRFGESSMIHTVGDGVEIAEMSGADNVFALADLYHVFGNNDSISGMRKFDGIVRHSHIAQPVKRVYPCSGDDDSVKYIYSEFLNTLSDIGCNTCSVEAHTDNFDEDIRNAVALIRSIIV